MKPDSALAPRLLATGCELGAMVGCTHLGTLHRRGLAVEHERAAALLRKACDGGDMRGCGHLAALRFAGEGGPPDPAAALALAKRACDAKGDAKSQAGCVVLGRLHATGVAAVRNDSVAANFFRDACDAGDPTGSYCYGDYSTGLGVEHQSFWRASQYYRDACEDGEALGCVAMANAHEKGAGAEKDPKQSAQFRKRACALGHTPACPTARPPSAPRAEGRGLTAASRKLA